MSEGKPVARLTLTILAIEGGQVIVAEEPGADLTGFGSFAEFAGWLGARLNVPAANRPEGARVIGPDGTTYRSVAEAAEAAGITRAGMSARLAVGNKGWRWLNGSPARRSHSRRGVRVRAPDGRVFESLSEAARALGVTQSAMNYRISRMGWEIIDEPEDGPEPTDAAR